MTTTINASTSAGLINTADTSGVLALQTASTTAVSISASQVVTLTNALPVTSGGTGVTTSTGTGAVVLGTSPTIATPTMTGQATIPTINLTGGQIAFPATQSASSDANTLDDYEEGTWTPTDNSGAGLSFTTSATYIKIGQMVIAWCQINYPSTANGNGAAIAGLPFTTASQDVYGGFTRYSTSQYIYATLAQGGNYGSLYNTSGGAITNATLSSKRVDFTYVYRSNA